MMAKKCHSITGRWFFEPSHVCDPGHMNANRFIVYGRTFV